MPLKKNFFRPSKFQALGCNLTAWLKYIFNHTYFKLMAKSQDSRKETKKKPQKTVKEKKAEKQDKKKSYD